MKEEIICSGSGGQGIIFMGKLLAWGTLKENKFVTYIPSYGAEMRGGAANCSVIISDSPIPSPLIENSTTLIVMNRNSLDRFEGRLKKGGLLIVNSSLIDRKTQRRDIEVIYLPTTQIAEEIGNIKVANMVALGAYIGKSQILSLKSLEEPLSYLLDEKELLHINLKALRKGSQIGKNCIE